KHKEIRLLVHPMVEAYLRKGWLNSIIRNWKKNFKMKLTLEANSSLQFLEYHFYDEAGEEVVI
ncbi:MAG: ribonuclease G, partial [Flavobacteriales bacterium]